MVKIKDSVITMTKEQYDELNKNKPVEISYTKAQQMKKELKPRAPPSEKQLEVRKRFAEEVKMRHELTRQKKAEIEEEKERTAVKINVKPKQEKKYLVDPKEAHKIIRERKQQPPPQEVESESDSEESDDMIQYKEKPKPNPKLKHVENKVNKIKELDNKIQILKQPNKYADMLSKFWKLS